MHKQKSKVHKQMCENICVYEHRIYKICIYMNIYVHTLRKTCIIWKNFCFYESCVSCPHLPEKVQNVKRNTWNICIQMYVKMCLYTAYIIKYKYICTPHIRSNVIICKSVQIFMFFLLLKKWMCIQFEARVCVHVYTYLFSWSNLPQNVNSVLKDMKPTVYKRAYS